MFGMLRTPYRIRLADQPNYTVVVDGGRRDDGGQLVLSVQAKDGNDKWFFETFQ